MRRWQIHCHHARLLSMGLFTTWSYFASGWRLKDTLFWDNLEGSGHIALLVVHLLHIICLTYAIILEMNECFLNLPLCFNVTTCSCSFSCSRDHCDVTARIELYINLLQHSYIHLYVPQILSEMANTDWLSSIFILKACRLEALHHCILVCRDPGFPLLSSLALKPTSTS